MGHVRIHRIVAILFIVLSCQLISPDRCDAADLSGRWSGYWVSHPTGHKGPLKATITRLDESHYSATFTGRFWKIFPFRYRATLRIVEEGDVVKLEGSNYLGRLMGTFSYQADVTETHFDATYSTCKDNGQWVMDRCCCASGGK